jgi:cytoskeletal protein RodZ
VSIGVSIFLIAVGAILKWAVTAHVSWINIQTAGTVLFVVGLAGLLISVVYTFWWAHRETAAQDQTRATRRPPPGP